MLKSIVQASVGTATRRHSISTFLKKSTWTSGGHFRCAGTSGIHRRHDNPGRSQTHPSSLPLTLTDRPSTSHPTSSQPKLSPSSQVSTPPSSHLKLSPSSQVSADCLGVSLSRLCLSPEEASATVQYRLPSVSSITQDAILDPVANVAIPLDLPTSIYRDFIDVPSTYGGVDGVIGDPDTSSTTTKRASNIIQKRHRKMKRHQYKKWRKRNRFRLRIRKQRRRKKQRERWQRHLNQFRFTELSAAEREAHLQKKRDRLNIFLRYLGVPVDDIIREKEGTVEEVSKKKKRNMLTRVIAPGGTGKIVPVPILPKGVIAK